MVIVNEWHKKRCGQIAAASFAYKYVTRGVYAATEGVNCVEVRARGRTAGEGGDA